MDELLTDLKSYDKHKAFRREAKAGGRLQGEMEAERSNKLFWAEEEDVQAKAGSSGFREPFVSWTGDEKRMMRRKLSIGSSDEARSKAALGGDNVVGSK